jgi:hypothetical protein
MRFGRLAMFAAAALALTLAAGAARADRITLKSGETFSGTVAEETDVEVVLKTISGTMKFPRASIEKIEKGGAASSGGSVLEEKKPEEPVAKIEPIEVKPADAAAKTEEAKKALVGGDWVKAGGLLEGLMALDETAFKAEDRLAATGALVTCYLQCRDAQGAARALARRAQLAADPNDKRRLLAAAEALREIGSVKVGEKTLTRYDEVVSVAMEWKAAQVLAQARDHAAKAERLNEMPQVDRAANQALTTLKQADVFQPGFSQAHAPEVLEILVENMMDGARKAVAHCEKVRPDIAQYRVLSKPAAVQRNAVVKVYLNVRQAGETVLRNIQPLAAKHQVTALYTKNEAEIKKLAADLDEYQYYPEGWSMGPLSYYGTRTTRVKIQLWSFGG